MAKPKRPPSRPAAACATAPQAADSGGGEPQGVVNSPARRFPPPLLGNLLLIAIAVHLALIVCSYLATVTASSVQNQLLDAFRPYLAAMHFDADRVALSPAASSPAEKTHLLLQTPSLRPQDDADWTLIDDPGVSGGDRQRRWQRLLATAAELSENQQGDLVAWLMLPIARTHPEAQQFRIDRQADWMSTSADKTAPSPYHASIVRDNGEPVGLVQVPPQRFTAPSSGADHD